MPLTDFWNRWRRRLMPREDVAKPPSLRETEKQRDAAARRAAEELATITTVSLPTAKSEDSNRS